jgi:predicted dehydrogenase
MKKIGLIGAGKMGISHLSILGMHPDVNVVGVADKSNLVTDVLRKLTNFPVYADYRELLDKVKPDAVFIATPTKFHDSLVSEMIDNKIHVFVEKPFCLQADKGIQIVSQARNNKVVNQVGYHNKFIGTFTETKKLLDSGYLGKITHFSGSMYGPVVVNSKDGTWRAKPDEGGGCLMDYAAHLLDLINHLIGKLESVKGADLISIYSKNVEDAIFCLLETSNGIHGMINVNWSDDTFRKMSTSLIIHCEKGKIEVDTTELKVYFKTADVPPSYEKGWNIRHINTLTPSVNYYLRGEEYSLQIDKFIGALNGTTANDINTFETALQTDLIIEKIKRFNN